MHVLLTLHAYLSHPGGAAGVTTALAEAYRHRGHDVDCYSFDDLPERLPHRARLAVFPAFVAHDIGRRHSRAGLDVVDASTADTSLWLATRGLRRGPTPKVVTRSHGLEHLAKNVLLEATRSAGERLSWKYPLYHGGLRLKEVGFTLRHSDASVYLNQAEFDFATQRLGVSPDRAMVAANGLADSLLGLPKPVSPDPHAPVGVAQIGSYIRGKGVKESASALNRLLAEWPSVRVLFLGTGCERARVLDDFDPQHHVRIEVVTRFARTDLPSLLANMHVKLFPTYSEGFSLALLEAMACGLAPITTSVPGPLAMVEADRSGLVVPPRDADALLDALRRLLSDRELLQAIRERAHERAQQFSWKRIADDTLAFYERVPAAQ